MIITIHNTIEILGQLYTSIKTRRKSLFRHQIGSGAGRGAVCIPEKISLPEI